MQVGRPKGRQAYRNQKSGQKGKTKAELRNFITTAAGGDGDSLIADYMRNQDGRIIGNRHLSAFEVLVVESQEMRALVQGINCLIEKSSDYKKRQFVSILRSTGMPLKVFQEMGCKNIGARSTCH